jgi:hypothetical protein
VVLAFLFFKVRGIPAPGDIASALTQHPQVYTLSLGHLGDLTLGSFAYLRLPLFVAGVAFLVGALGAWRFVGQRAFLALALMMVVFFHAARLAMVVFDPYLSSRPLAEALLRAPQGQWIVDGAYYPFSSVFFYANRQGLLWNGRVNNLEYGSFAPGAPNAFIDNADFERLWFDPARCFLIADRSVIPQLERLVGRSALYQVAESGGKLLLTNEPLRVSLEHSPMREGRQAKW